MKLFGPEWEAGECLNAVICVTLQDYFKDLSEWLPRYFFSKFIREFLPELVITYVKGIIRLIPSNFSISMLSSTSSSSSTSIIYQFNSELVVARRIIDDVEALKAFFAQYAQYLTEGASRRGGGDFESICLAGLSPMVQLAKVISATHISGAENEVKILFEKMGAIGLKVVTAALVCNPSLNRQEKEESVAVANKIFSKSGNVYSNSTSNEKTSKSQKSFWSSLLHN